jgi:hypothetical protein
MYVYCLLLLIIWLLPMFIDDDKINKLLNKENQIIFTVIIIVLFIIHKIYI